MNNVLLKIGGRAFSGKAGFIQLADAMRGMPDTRFIIVHGGGSEISEALKTAGRKTAFVDGIRVTQKPDMDIVEKVLSETVNARIAGYLETAGISCCRMSGKTDGLMIAAPMKSRRGKSPGFVGRITTVNPAPILAAFASGCLPVISPVSADSSGQSYNVNADSAAAALAGGIPCPDLVFFTDVPGVTVDGIVLHRLTENRAKILIADGKITGGMIAKLESAFAVLRAGVKRIHIAKWNGSLTKILVDDQPSGTTIQ